MAKIRKVSTAPLGEWVEHFEKITQSFLPKLFSYLQQPLLPLTNNELEIFIGQLKKRRRQVTGRKNTQAFSTLNVLAPVKLYRLVSLRRVYSRIISVEKEDAAIYLTPVQDSVASVAVSGRYFRIRF